MTDLTRWNRSGRRRFEYVDGNAVTHLELLRKEMERIVGPDWAAVSTADGGGTQDLLDRYAMALGDPGWEILRAAARAAHIVTSHIDAYANEAFIGTATQVELLRRLVSAIDYHPAPASSATTMLAFAVEDDEVDVPHGTAIRHTPSDGPAIVFETLLGLTAHRDLNEIRHFQADENQTPLGNPITLSEEVPVIVGDPIVLVADGEAIVRKTEAIALDPDGRPILTLDEEELPGSFKVGNTTVHTDPKDRLGVMGPTSNEVGTTGNVLRLAQQPSGIRYGDVIWIEPGGASSPLDYRVVKGVGDHWLRLDSGLTGLVVGSTMIGPALPVAILDQEPGGVAVMVEGDWEWLEGNRVGIGSVGAFRLRWFFSGTSARRELRPPSLNPDSLETILISGATYHDADATDDEKRGRTEVVFETTPGILDGEREVPESIAPVDRPLHEAGGSVERMPRGLLRYPQLYLFVVPEHGAGSGIGVDAPLEGDERGSLPTAVQTSALTHTVSGDFLVLSDGPDLAVAEVAAAVASPDATTGEISVVGWRDDAGDEFYTATTRAFSHFSASSRIHLWDRNDTPLTGHTDLPVPSGTQGLETGRLVVIEHSLPPGDAGDGSPQPGAYTARLIEVTANREATILTLSLPFPEGFTADSVSLRGNVVDASHGQRQESVVLGSGSADQVRQRFTIEVPDVTFVPDPVFPSGTRADVVVTVSGRRWTQVPSLQDSRPDDHHYTSRLDSDGHLLIEFGDGLRGRRLPTGENNVTASYRTGSGLAGNLPAGSLSEMVRPVPGVDGVTQPIPAGGGGAGDDVDDIRENAPSSTLALGRAVSLGDYEALAARRSDVWQARARRGRSAVGTGEGVEVVIVPAGGSGATASLIEDVRTALASAAAPSVVVRVTGFHHVEIALRLKIAVKADEYDLEEVRQETRVACIAAFGVKRRKLGQGLGRSEVMNVAEEVVGVENALVTIDPAVELHLADAGATDLDRVRLWGPDGEIRLVHAADDQVLALSIDSPDVTVVPREYQP